MALLVKFLSSELTKEAFDTIEPTLLMGIVFITAGLQAVIKLLQ